MQDDDTALPQRPFWLTALPVGVFLAIAGLFFYALRAGDPARLPSALIGKPAPAVTLTGVEGLKRATQSVPGFGPEDFSSNRVTVVNVWASWCTPCTREHPQLVALAKRPGLQLFGINYKDKAVAARRFLGRYGNPFARVGTDATGRASVEWGLTGVPETFVVDQRGRIRFKFVGELTPVTYRKILLPAIENVERAPAG